VVTPEDVRWSIERGFKLRSTFHRQYFRGVVGAAACSSRPATCRLSRGIVTDPSANTVTFHLTRPDPNFLYNWLNRRRSWSPPGHPPRTSEPAPYRPPAPT
jgi:peptide/nickel transport system substrate-binding protein